MSASKSIYESWTVCYKQWRSVFSKYSLCNSLDFIQLRAKQQLLTSDISLSISSESYQKDISYLCHSGMGKFGPGYKRKCMTHLNLDTELSSKLHWLYLHGLQHTHLTYHSYHSCNVIKPTLYVSVLTDQWWLSGQHSPSSCHRTRIQCQTFQAMESIWMQLLYFPHICEVPNLTRCILSSSD